MRKSYKDKIKDSSRFGGKGSVYKPKNPSKYFSRTKYCVCQSKLELKFAIFCDTSNKVVKWANEPFFIPYYNPIKKKMSRYYPDFYVEIVKNNVITKYVVEIKPKSLVPGNKLLKRPSKNARTSTIKNYNKKLVTIAINKAKRDAAIKFCKEKGYKYMFVTEKFFES